MKFVSWNVNGLRACIQKGFLEQFDNLDADFFCLQETKLSEGQLELDLPGYYQYWNYAEKKGYSGTAIFTKHEPLSVQYGIGVPELDNEGRVITLEYAEFFLVTCYTPNAQRELARIDHRLAWDEAFRSYLHSLDARKSVVVCGDLNVARHEIDLKNPASNRNNAGFSDQERASFEKTLALGFTDTFRHLHPDTTGAYTWWSYMYNARKNNAGWRIDYFLTSDRLCDSINRAQIHPDIHGSDHCPVSLDLGITVNGSIISPIRPNSSRQTFPAPKPPKESKTATAFAPIAKAVLAFSLIFAIVCGGMYFFNDALAQFSVPTTSTEPVGAAFEVTANYYPVEKCSPYLGYSSTMVTTTPAGTSAVTDGETTYYIDNDYEQSLKYANFTIICTTDSEQFLPDFWSLLLAGDSEFSQFTAAPYYRDVTLTDCRGWLIWGNLSEEGSFELTLSHTSGSCDRSYSLKLVPYLSIYEIADLSLAELAAYVANHDHYCAILSENYDLAKDSLWNFVDQKLQAHLSMLANTEGIQALMDLSDISGEAKQTVHLLLGCSGFLNAMTPEQEANYLTHQYNACPYGLVLSALEYIFEEYTTDELYDDLILSTACGRALSQCSTSDSAGYIVTYFLDLSENNNALRELLTREDAISCLLSRVKYSSDKTAAMFLSHDEFQALMSDAAKTTFYQLLFDADTHRFCQTLGIYAEEETVSLLSTEQLLCYIDYLMSYGHIDFSTQNYYEKKVALSATIPCAAISELARRDDAIELLFTSQYISPANATQLLSRSDLRKIMTAQQEVSYMLSDFPNCLDPIVPYFGSWVTDNFSTEELIRHLSNAEVSLLCSQYTASDSSALMYDKLLEYSDLLRALDQRSDAVEALMTTTSDHDARLSYMLLSLPTYQNRMTAQQLDRYARGDYPAAPATEE